MLKDWNKNWTFQIVHIEGGIYIEAKALGVLIRKPLLATKAHSLQQIL